MFLSRLVYEIVKNVKYLSDTGFVYEAFKKGEFNNDPDYARNINNVRTPLNMAIHRLSDRDKIKNKVDDATFNEEGNIDLKKLTLHPKCIVAVAYFENGQYQRTQFQEVGNELIPVVKKPKMKVEYKVDIPSILNTDFTEEGNDFDLYDLGINETMCSYIIHYCKGMLFKNIDPGMANNEFITAEEYFADLKEPVEAFRQNKVHDTVGRKYFR